MRFGDAPSLSLGGGSIYYGTADATPLFVMLLGELRRWGLAREVVDELLPNADRALEWIEHFGDRDGDGYVEYQRTTDRGLANQGWKDSWDGIRYADGRVAEAPIALCEVQAYVYGAYLARAHFALEAGDTATFDRYRAKAAAAEGRLQPGLLARGEGLVRRRPRRRQAADRLAHLQHRPLPVDRASSTRTRPTHRGRASCCRPSMFSGWGVRTLATSMGGYNPISYHCGSVWPHDTAIVAAGPGPLRLRRRGPAAHLGAARRGRGPGRPAARAVQRARPRASSPSPVGYPTSCSPQAWAAASPLLCLRTMLRLDPWVPYGKTWLSPDPARGDRLPQGGRASRWPGRG